MSSKLQSITISNFKRFPSLTIPLDSESIVISGANGTGKTQILYALLLFFRGHNLHFHSSGAELEVHYGFKALNLRKEASWLFHWCFEKADSFEHFIRDRTSHEKTEHKASFTGHFGDNSSLTCLLYANGDLWLTRNQDHQVSSKISYASVGQQFHFVDEQQELKLMDPLTTNLPHIRYCYSRLTSEFQQNIKEHLRSFFPSIEDVLCSGGEGEQIKLHLMEDGKRIDPLATGSAFQKIFATFTLFYSLLLPRTLSNSKPEPVTERYFLMEEPEALLYPSLVLPFFCEIIRLCKEKNVKLITVSNSEAVWNQVSKHLLLSSKKPAFVDSRQVEELANEIGVPIPDDKQPVLFVDGPDDVTFISKFVNWPQLHLRKANDIALKTSENKKHVSDLFKKYNVRHVFLQDPEFAPPEFLLDNIPTVYWELPCIESYLILNHLLKDFKLHGFKEDKKQELQNFLQWEQSEYFKGLGDAVAKYKKANKKRRKDLNSTFCGVRYYSEALAELEKDTPDFVKIVKVIHGHTYLQTVLGEKTSDYIKKVSQEGLEEEVRSLLSKTITKIQELLRINDNQQ